MYMTTWLRCKWKKIDVGKLRMFPKPNEERGEMRKQSNMIDG